MTERPRSIEAMRDELKLLGMERRDHLDLIKRLGKRAPEMVALSEYRLAVYRDAYLKFCELTGAKP